jgi:hypothetical protein
LWNLDGVKRRVDLDVALPAHVWDLDAVNLDAGLAADVEIPPATPDYRHADINYPAP